MEKNLTQGGILQNLIRFSVPYLVACFLQTFYGLADLFITGQFNGPDAISGVSIGSQVMHMLILMISGLSMGSTVAIAAALGARDTARVRRTIGQTVLLFAGLSAVLAAALLALIPQIVGVLDTPEKAVGATSDYLRICFFGLPFVVFYNVISSIFRGLGDSRSPMLFVFAAGILNVILDVILIGPCHMGAAGAAYGTIISEAASVALAVWAMVRAGRRGGAGSRVQAAAAAVAAAEDRAGQKPAAEAGGAFALSRGDLRPHGGTLARILRVGIPIMAQEGVIQISFLVITMIANGRGLDVSASVGIVEKLIMFFFLVPSAMLSTVSAIGSQCRGAGLHERARKTLFYGMGICVAFGLFVVLICELWAEPIVGVFAKGEAQIAEIGGAYLRSYVFDCALACIHFCFCGYFSAYEKAFLSFLHNILSVVLVRIPGAYLATLWWPETLFPMGVAAPLGSVLSIVICAIAYHVYKKRGAFGTGDLQEKPAAL